MRLDRRLLQGAYEMTIEIGQLAPDFELASHRGSTVRLSDFRGRKNVLIAFYPLAWTSV
jgi:peroxiredoxin